MEKKWQIYINMYQDKIACVIIKYKIYIMHYEIVHGVHIQWI